MSSELALEKRREDCNWLQLKRQVAGTNWQSLQEEIGVLRMLLSEHLDACKTQGDLILKAGPIAALADKIEKLVSSCNKLEINLNLHLSKDQLVEVASGIVEIAARYVPVEKFEDFGNDVGARPRLFAKGRRSRPPGGWIAEAFAFASRRRSTGCYATLLGELSFL